MVDPALQTTYKRQVHMIVLNQDPKSVVHSLPPPSISLTVADIAELIVELGLVETSWTDVTERLQISSTTDILVEEWSGRDAPPVHLWTDGSVVLSKSYWKTRAAYAVIDSNTCVVASGKVHHFHPTQRSFLQSWSHLLQLLGPASSIPTL